MYTINPGCRKLELVCIVMYDEFKSTMEKYDFVSMLFLNINFKSLQIHRGNHEISKEISIYNMSIVMMFNRCSQVSTPNLSLCLEKKNLKITLNRNCNDNVHIVPFYPFGLTQKNLNNDLNKINCNDISTYSYSIPLL